LRKRTRARELALQALYQLDLRGESVLDDVGRLLDEGTGEPSVRLFARELIDGVREHQPELDAAIAAVAENWDLGRMAVVDRNLLRIGAFELLHLDDVPPKVSINEAVDLAKSYADTQSGAFVNGILDRIRQEHVPAKGQDNGRPAEPTSEDESS
jgi:transcription antitermination factor NusB